MFDLMDLYWHGALHYWFHSGSTDGIVYALEQNIPMKPNEARFVAAIMAGKVQPWGKASGPQYPTRQEKHYLKALIVVPLFERAFRVAKWHSNRHPEMKIDPRAEACEWVSTRIHGKYTPSTVETIVGQPGTWKKSLISDEGEREFRALFASCQKKPSEVL